MHPVNNSASYKTFFKLFCIILQVCLGDKSRCPESHRGGESSAAAPEVLSSLCSTGSGLATTCTQGLGTAEQKRGSSDEIPKLKKALLSGTLPLSLCAS